MKLDYNLKLEQAQKLIITPELKLAITLLQYSALELQDHIQEELLNNPVLEVQETREEAKGEEAETAPEEPAELSYADEIPWDKYFRDMDLDHAFNKTLNTKAQAEYPPLIENCACRAGTMQDDLLGQLRILPLTSRQYSTAAFLVGNLDQNGYLQGELEELAPVLGAEVEELEEALRLVQNLEPTGIGCRNLRECLLLQLQKTASLPPWAAEIIRSFLPAAADGRFSYIASRLGCGEDQVREAVEFIRTLNPKPGGIFGEGEEPRYIIPDVIVEKVDDQYLVMGNDSSIPQLTISPFYRQIIKSGGGDEQTASFVKGKIEKAVWLIRSIEQRRLTLFRVSQQIVNIQKPFLDEGLKKLKPLNLKEVALNVGVHESTVSRATANKYIQTPRGLFPMKFFFSSGLSGSGGDNHSPHSIKIHIRELIDAEESHKPLSDQRLTAVLQERGINISRRTVAKYREEIGIPASYKRRL